MLLRVGLSLINIKPIIYKLAIIIKCYEEILWIVHLETKSNEIPFHDFQFLIDSNFNFYN